MKLHLHNSRSQTRNSSLLKIITKNTICIPGYHVEHKEEFSIVRHPIHRVFQNHSFAVVYDSHSHLWNNPAITRNYSTIVDSCNGLLLLEVVSETVYGFEYWLCVWNICDPSRDFDFAFGCDNSTGAYKVVAFCKRETTSDVKVLNLGVDVWRNIESFPVVLDHEHVCLSGTINWLATPTIHTSDTVEHSVIVSLDLETEAYKQYTVPRGVDEVLPDSPTIGVLGGCLCFSYLHRETHFDIVIWQMKKFGVEDSWTQFLKVSYHDLLIDYGNFSDNDICYFQLVPIFLSEDGDSLILQSNLESQTILLYDRRHNRAKRTEIIASTTISDIASTTIADFRNSNYVYQDFAKGYVESLVPIF